MTLRLTREQQDILEGKAGETLAKVLGSVVRYGEAFGASELVPLTGPVHLVTSFGARITEPLYRVMDELVRAGLRTTLPFTLDPRPYDFDSMRYTIPEKLLFRFIYSRQEEYERSLRQVGLRDEQAFSCACYLEEVGNIPAEGDVLAWAESSAVAYANSVLAARTNRNSALIELFSGILGLTPRFGLLTEEGRKARWLVEVKTGSKPEAQILGSAIGMRVMEDVPYITGLDRHVGDRLTAELRDYLKDMGAAAASNGAVGLYHVENVTPEARRQGRRLLDQACGTYVVDDAELARIRGGYPQLWRKPDARPKQCFIGCPHLSYAQAVGWLGRTLERVERARARRLAVPTALCCPPAVAEKVRAEQGERCGRFFKAGGRLTSLCPLMHMSNPLCARKSVITNSNKLRTYTTARYHTDEEILELIVGGTE